MKALVAGGAGFIGSTLVDRLLAEGHAVDVIDDLSTGSLLNLADARAARTGALHIHQVDVREPEVVGLVERRAPDVVYQLAAPPGRDAAADVTGTVIGTLRLLEGAQRGGVGKVVALLDASIYGPVDAATVTEADAGEPSAARGVAQLAAVEYLRLYRDQHRIDFTVLVADAVYGPRQREGVVVDAARTALAGEIPPAASGGADLVFVDDVVDALDRAGDRAGGLLLNLGWGRAAALAAVAAVVADAAGLNAAPPAARTSADAVALDAGRAKIHLGWAPWTTLEEGVSRTLRWLAG